MKEIIIIGSSGHASVIIDIIKSMIECGDDLIIKGLLDDRKDLKEFMGYKILGTVDDWHLFNTQNIEFIIGIGNNNIRKSIANKLTSIKFFTAIHSSALIGSNVKIKQGTVVMQNAVVNANTTIGEHCIINSSSVVEHDNIIYDFVHISPSTTLCGGVRVGDTTHIGANSVVIPGIKIGSNTIIGAGSSVIKDISSNVVAVGCPAKIIKENINI